MMKPIHYEKLQQQLWHDVLDNGLNIYVLPKEGFNKKYAFFATNYGGCDRRFRLGGQWLDTPAGIAHFLEHKMFDMPYGSAMTRLTESGASPNAFTSNGMTGYLFSCTDSFDENLRTMLEYVSTPYYTEQSVDKEQGIIGQEIRMGEDNPMRAAVRGLLRALYEVHPVRDDIAGTVESIAEITADTLYSCHKVFYNPSNMVLCVAGGDISPESVRDIAAELITAPAGEVPERDYGEEPSLLPVRVRTVKKMAVGTPVFTFGSKMPYGGDGREWTKRLLTAQLACDMLAGVSSRLYADMYASGLINDEFYCGVMDFPCGAVVMAEGRCEDPAAVLERVSSAAAEFTVGAEEAELFARLKKIALGGFISGLDFPDNMCHAMAEGHFAGCLPFEYLDIFSEIEIDDALRFIKEQFAVERLSLSVVEPVDREA